MFSASLWTVAAGIFFVAFGARGLYERYLHRAWRKQRRLVRACEKAFDEGSYRLERLRTSQDAPSFADLFPIPPFHSEQSYRYFTYEVEVLGETTPDFSGMSKEEVRLVRRYLQRTAKVPHHGKEVLRPLNNENSESSPSKALG